MEKNLLLKLKENKRFMKLSATALISTISLYGGVSYSVSAMKQVAPVGSKEVQKAKVQNGSSKELLGVGEADQDQVMDQKLFFGKKGDTVTKDRDMPDVREMLDGVNLSAITDILDFAKKEHEEDCYYLLQQVYDLYVAAYNVDMSAMRRLLTNVDDDVLYNTMRIAREEKADYVVDVLNEVMIVLFCEKYGGSYDAEKGSINLSKFNDGFVDDLLVILKHCTIFKSLNLGDGFKLGDQGASKISEALKVNTTLTDLNLRNSNIGSEGAAKIAEVLKINITLTTLNLSDNNIGVEGALKIAEALKVNTTLTMLYLGGNKLGAEGTRKIFDAIKTNHTVKVVGLHRKGVCAKCDERPAIFEAIIKGDIGVVRNLIEDNIDAKDKNEQSPLHVAVACGNKDIVELLLENGANVDAKDKFGQTPLHIAITYGARGIVEVLLSKMEGKVIESNLLFSCENLEIAKLLARHIGVEMCNSLLFDVVDKGKNLVALNALLYVKGIDVNKVDENGNTPLHIAVARGDKGMVGLLLGKGANVEVKNDEGKTPLAIAVAGKKKEIVECLLSKMKGKIIESSLLFSCENSEIANLLAQCMGVQVCNRLLFEAVGKNNLIALKALLNVKGIDVNIVDEDGNTPLHRAISKNSKDIILELLNVKSINVMLSNNIGVIPIVLAVRSKCIDEVVKKLLEKSSASIDLATIDMLINTCTSKKVKKLLIETKAKELKKAKEAMKVRKAEEEKANLAKKVAEVREAESRKDEKLQPKKRGMSKQDLSTTSVIIRQVKQVPKSNKSKTAKKPEQVEKRKQKVEGGSTHLQGSVSGYNMTVELKQLSDMTPAPRSQEKQVAESNNPQIAEKAAQEEEKQKIKGESEQQVSTSAPSTSVERKLEVSTFVPRITDSSSIDYLFDVIEQNDDRAAVDEFLLHNPGVNINAKNSAGYTPLHLAVIKRRLNIVERLLEENTLDVNAKDDEGNTPLHLAIKLNMFPIVIQLLRKEAIDVNEINKDGNTPLELAALLGNRYVIISELLKKDQLDVNIACGKLKLGPLHCAVMKGDVTSVKVLLSCERINIHEKSVGDLTALDLIENVDSEMFKLVQREGIDRFCKRYGAVVNVEHGIFDLSNRKIDIEGVFLLVDLLKRDKTFQVLNLSDCKLSKEGVKKILDMLKINTTLKTVYLQGKKQIKR